MNGNKHPITAVRSVGPE